MSSIVPSPNAALSKSVDMSIDAARGNLPQQKKIILSAKDVLAYVREHPGCSSLEISRAGLPTYSDIFSKLKRNKLIFEKRLPVKPEDGAWGQVNTLSHYYPMPW